MGIYWVKGGTGGGGSLGPEQEGGGGGTGLVPEGGRAGVGGLVTDNMGGHGIVGNSAQRVAQGNCRADAGGSKPLVILIQNILPLTVACK